MSEIKPKKERRFLKTLGRIGEVLVEQVLLKLGSSIIRKIGGKKTLPSILFLFLSLSLFAQFPNTLNKQRLGFQTTGDGLTWRGSISDTASIQPVNNQSAWVILDTINLKFYTFDFTSNVWNLVGGAAFAQPVDSLFFNVNVPTNNVDTAKMRWDSDLATVVLGLNDNVSNELGFKNFWLVKNQTGSTIAKGSLVYANGTVGSSGRITVDKFIANGSIDAKYLLGITAHDLTDGEDGYVISFGKIRQVNTDTFAAGAILYPSPTVAGVWTDVEPIAPNIDMPIGFCINSSANNGTIAIRVASGYKLLELHDVAISSPVEKSSLYYSGGLWRDTTAALLVSDTAAMLANYSLKGYVDSIAQNFQDSIDEITNGYFKQEFPTVTKDTLNWTKPVQLPVGGSNLLLVYRNGQMINDAQYSVIDTNKVKINSGSYKLGENYTIVYVKGGGGSGGGGTTFDTSILNLQSRLNLKLNLSDTASMLANYATKAYADTTGRLYARQDYTTGVTSSTLTWTQSDTLIPGGVNVVQVYRNGQILLPSQYTIPTSTSVVIAASSFKVNDNYTVIFPRGGGAGSGGGSGSLTSISAGTGITVSPNPITTTGVVSADLSVLMELTDTSLLNLNSRFATKLNISDTATMLSNYNTRINSKLNISDTLSMLAPYFRDADTTSLNLISRFALKLNAADTASLSNRINAKGTGTVQNIATGYGITGGTITTTGTLLLDSAVVFSRIRDSIVDVAIGNDTIKILKQEYAPATTSVLTWTVTSKFPIQSKAFILVFRNGQLLINDQYNLTDTNKITVVSNSFKVGANYTVVTVSGIGSVGTGVFPNPVYPEAGISVSTGSAWASSIANNSSNWNIAFNDKITNAAFSGTNIKTLTLTQYDGGTFAPTFTDLQGVTSVTAGTGLTGGTITSTGTVAVDFGVVAPLASPTFTGTVSGITKSMVGLGNVDNTSDANKPVSTATQTALNLKVNISDTASMLTPYFRDADTTSLNLTSRFNTKLNLLDTSNMLVPYLRKADTTNMLLPYFRDADTTQLNLTSRFAAKLNLSDTLNMLVPYLRKADTTQLNLTSRFAAKQNTLSGTGFVKASGTNITYDNSSYLRTGLADSTYLKLTGGTLTGGLTGTTGTFNTKLIAGNVGGSSGSPIFTAGLSGTETEFHIYQGTGYEGSPTTLRLTNNNGGYYQNGLFLKSIMERGLDEYNGRIGIMGTDFMILTKNSRIGIFNASPSTTLDVNGTLNATGATTLGSTLAVTGAVTLSTTTATPASLLGKDGSNIVGNVRLTSPLALAGDSLNLGTVPISKGGTGADNASLARTLLSVGYNFVQVTAGSSVTITSNRVSVVNTGGFSTTQLDLTPATNGRMYMIKNLASGTVTSLHSNVIPLTGGSPTTAILSAGNATPQWVTLVADGTNWHVMQSN